MVYEYQKIEEVGSDIYEWYKGILLKERLLYGGMIELLLESAMPLGEYILPGGVIEPLLESVVPQGEKSKDKAYDKMTLSILATRLFNNAEGAKYLLLRGLPDQANMVIRDIIECVMLFRLFLKNPKLAKRWLMESKEYQLGDVDAKLSQMGINAREYAFYGMLSHEGHTNLLASLSHVQEKEIKGGMLRAYHFGSTRTPEAIFSVQQNFLTLFFLLHISLIEPLAEFYYQHSDKDSFSVWAQKVTDLFPKIEALVAEVNTKSGKKGVQVDKHILELIDKKMRLKEFKIRLLKPGAT